MNKIKLTTVENDFLKAAYNGDLDFLKPSNLTPEKKFYINQEIRDKGLSIAAAEGKTKFVYALKNMSNLNAQNESDANTPLMSAVIAPHFPVVKTLIKLGANVSVLNKDGQTALDLAIDHLAHSIEIDFKHEIPIYKKIIKILKIEEKKNNAILAKQLENQQTRG